MKPISDDDLVLLYYGEHEDPGLAARVAGDENLSRRFDAIGTELGQLDRYAPPPRDEDYGAATWQAISARLWSSGYLPGEHAATSLRTSGDPILFIKAWVPATYLEPGKVFDFTDIENDAASQLFNEVVGSLAPAFSMYTNDPSKGNRITKIQQDSIGFAQSLSAAVEQNYQWASGRGLQIVATAIISIEYDETTRELLRNVQRADALSGARGNSNLQASVASGSRAGHLRHAEPRLHMVLAAPRAGPDHEAEIRRHDR